jgi:hypothetical protein
MSLSKDDKLNLNKLLEGSDCENNTMHIRTVKHSVAIRDDIRKMDVLKKQYSGDELKVKCECECNFLFNNYTDIFNRMLKDELDLTIMTKLLTILKMIEDGKVDQHEGSVMVGKLLKELYVDSAIKRGENLDKMYEKEAPVVNEGKAVSWKQFKAMN